MSLVSDELIKNENKVLTIHVQESLPAGRLDSLMVTKPYFSTHPQGGHRIIWSVSVQTNTRELNNLNGKFTSSSKQESDL